MKIFQKSVCAAVAVATMFSLGGCLKYTSNILEVTTAGNEPSTTPVIETTMPQVTVPTTVISNEITTAEPNVTVVVETTIASTPGQTVLPGTDPVTTAPANADVQTTAAEKDPSQWSKAEIISYLTTAINKTKGFKGNVSVSHKESVEATVTSCPGGSAVKNIVNKVVSSAVKPTDETLNFANGTAVSSEGETLQFLLPKAGNFSLPESGAQSATASKNGNIVTINIALIAETGSLNANPPVHSNAAGFLDIGSVDLSSITVSKFDTSYNGTKMVFTIDTTTGYVKTAEYTIPVDISVTGKALGITADVGLTAKEVESWNINW